MTENNDEVFIKKNSNTEGFELLCNFSYFHKVAFKVTIKGVELLAVPVNNEDPYVHLLVQNECGNWDDLKVINSDIEKVEKIDFMELPNYITKHAGECSVFIDLNRNEINTIHEAMIIEGLDPKDKDAFEGFIVDALKDKLKKIVER